MDNRELIADNDSWPSKAVHTFFFSLDSHNHDAPFFSKPLFRSL